MEPVFEKRRRNGKRINRSKAGLSKGERRRLLQLAVSLLVFAIALLGRNVFPERFEQWNELLYQEIDFKSAFSDFGEAAAQGEPLMDSLGELCVEVFGRGEIQNKESALIFNDVPSISERCRGWGQSVRLDAPDKLI